MHYGIAILYLDPFFLVDLATPSVGVLRIELLLLFIYLMNKTILQEAEKYRRLIFALLKPPQVSALILELKRLSLEYHDPIDPVE